MAGPLTDIVHMLLTALFNVQDEEAAENKASQSQAGILIILNIIYYDRTKLIFNIIFVLSKCALNVIKL